MTTTASFTLPSYVEGEILPNLAETYAVIEAQNKNPEPCEANLDLLKRTGVTIAQQPIPIVPELLQHIEQERALLHETYPAIAAQGIVGLRMRTKTGKTKTDQLHAPLLFTKEALSMDMAVAEAIAGTFIEPPIDPATEEFFPVPSPFIREPDDEEPVEGPLSFFDVSTDVPVIALVAITPVVITMFPHSSAIHESMKKLFNGSEGMKNKYKRTPQIGPELTQVLTNSKYQVTMTLYPGEVLVTYTWMPMSLSRHVKPDDESDEPEAPAQPYIVKLVAFDRLKKGHKRRSAWTRVLAANGTFSAGQFNEVLYHKRYPAIEVADDAPAPEITLATAQPVDMPFLTGEKAGGPPKAKRKTVLPEEPAAEDSADKSSPIKQPTKISASSKLDSANAELEALRGEINGLDPLVWDPKHEEKVNEFAELQQPEKAVNFIRAIATLAKRVSDAKTAQADKLPLVKERLSDCRELLDAMDDLPEDAKAEIKRREGCATKLMAIEALTHNLIGETTALEKLHTSLMELTSQIEKRKAKLSEKKKRGRETDSPIEFVIEEVDESELDPDVIADRKIWAPLLRDMGTKLAAFNTMATAQKAAVPYYNKFRIELMRHIEYGKTVKAALEKDPSFEPEPLDCTLMNAYYTVLQNANDNYIAQTKKRSTTAGAKPKVKHGKINCKECGENRINFGGEGMCKECYTEFVVAQRLDNIHEREGRLHKLAEMEARNMGQDDEELGPHQTALQIYEPISEEIQIAYDEFAVVNATYAKWEVLKSLFEKAEAMLPVCANSNDDDAYSEGDESDHNNVRILDDDEENSDMSSYSRSSEENGRVHKKHDADEEDDEKESIRHDLIMAILRLPVSTLRAELLRYYVQDRLVLLREKLDDLKNIKQVHTLLITNLDPPMPPFEHHDCFLTYKDAMSEMFLLSVPKINTIKVITKDV